MVARARLAPSAWWPAGEDRVSSRRIALRTGLAVRVVEAGPASGAPIVMVHGWGINAYLWRHTIPALTAAGHRVHAMDLPGHGLSDKPLAPGSYTLARMTEHVEALLDALGIEAAAIVAQSMGGRIATELAITRPQRVRGLALLGSVGFGATGVPGAIVRQLPAPPRAITPILSQRWIVAIGKAYSYGRRAAIAQPDIDAYWAATQFPDFVPALHRVLSEFDWRPLSPEALGALRVPVLVVFGTRDRMVRPLRVAERVAAVPQGRLHLVRDAGHVANEEAPDEVNPLLVEFIGSLR